MPFEGRIFEWMIVAVIALIVIGPKDLPPLMRKLGQAMGKMRSMAAEFRASFDEMARHSELDELRKEVEAMRAVQVDAAKAAADAFRYDDPPPPAAFHVPPVAADTAAVEAPIAEPEEPTLFDLDAHPAGTKP